MKALPTSLPGLVALATLAACSSGPQPPANPERRTCDFEGMELQYLDAGSGEPAFVLVHGWAGAAGVWRHNLPDLAAHARVLAMDLPGHGGNAAPLIDYTADRMARSIAAVMDDAGCHRAILVGHSNGGPLVRLFQRLYPDRTAALVFVEAPLKSLFDLDAARSMAGPLLGPRGEAAAARMIDGVVASVPLEHRAEIRAIAADTPLHVLHSTLIEGNVPELFSDQPIPVPVLAIYAPTRFWDQAYEDHVRRLCPDLDYRVWDGVGHFPMLDRPAWFQASLRSFRRRLVGDEG